MDSSWDAPGASCSLSLEVSLEEVTSDETEIQQLCILHRGEIVHPAFGGQGQGRVKQDVVLVVALADHGEDDAVPALEKIVDLVASVAQYRVTDVHPTLVDLLHDHEMLV